MITYKSSGVDIEAGDELVRRLKEKSPHIGGFGGCFPLSAGRWKNPVLVASTDGVGTKLLVAEADESDGAFLVYEPDGAIVTNVDADHLDNYGTVEAYAEAFDQFVTHIGSFVVLNADDAGARALAAAAADRGLTVLMAGFAGDANLQARDLVIDATSSTFTVSHDGVELGFVRLAVPGAHYAQDAVLALGAGLLLGEEFGPLAMGLATYTGAARRMQLLGAAGGVRVYDSYAHHPTEIAADLAAARAIADGDRLVVVWAASTEIFLEESAAHMNLEAFEAAMEANDKTIAPSMLYGYAALMEGVPLSLIHI